MPLPRAGGRRGVGPAWGELRSLRGVVERIVFHDAEDGYVVARLTCDGPAGEPPAEALGADGLVTVAGTMPEAVVGEAVEARGWWRQDRKHGWTFRVAEYRTTLPATVLGIRRYLSSGLVPGIGPVIAGRIVDHFGADTLALIDGTPERLREVPGVGPVRAERVAAAWTEHRQVHEVMVALQSHGVSTGLAARIYRKYRQNSVRMITTDPYRLAREVVGIGFKTADKIARGLGTPADAPERVRSAVVHALRDLALRGDTRVGEARLAEQAMALLGVEGAPVEAAIAELIGERQIVAARLDGADQPDGQPGRLLADARLAAAEATVAERLLRLRDEAGRTLLGHACGRREWDDVFGPGAGQFSLVNERGEALTAEQERAVRTALTEPVSIVTGGPGTGKTFALRAILEAAERVGARVLLAAPTGRAAQRMREATGRDARTIHRLLELRPGGAGWRGAGGTLPADCVIVDEASMVDVPLMHRLVRAVAPGAHLVLVGDPDQLPSVGPGNVLADLIASGRFPATTLTHVFRHGAGSGIALAARAVRGGQMPPAKASTDDYYFVRRDDPEAAAETVVKLVAERIPAHLGCAPADVQVLAPMHRGPVGVGALNARLQQALNPRRDTFGARNGARELRAHGRLFREGDRVMQLRNDYGRSVFNGDMGTVERIDSEEGEVAVRLEDQRLIRYRSGDLSELTHCWASTIHKAQGNEFPAIVLVVMTSHALALNRTLLYTALTRARRLAVVVGQEKAFEMGVDNWRFTRRVTALGHLLVDPESAARTRDAQGTTADEDPAEWEPFYADDEDALWDALVRVDEAGRRPAP
ncbi:MAG TPA: ATP-dependent RecD-like DNA helicase [Chloroflexota bacterium]|jgi:exodeoxyribonuclease V alpha subunit